MKSSKTSSNGIQNPLHGNYDRDDDDEDDEDAELEMLEIGNAEKDYGKTGDGLYWSGFKRVL